MSPVFVSTPDRERSCDSTRKFWLRLPFPGEYPSDRPIAVLVRRLAAGHVARIAFDVSLAPDWMAIEDDDALLGRIWDEAAKKRQGIAALPVCAETPGDQARPVHNPSFLSRLRAVFSSAYT